MARYDKYDPISGGFRALLANDFSKEDLNKPIGVGLDANGLVVKGAGQSGIRGVMILTKARKAGDVVDIMTNGEIVDLGEDDGVTAAAGTKFYAADADGAVTSDASANLVGSTVEAQRLVVRFQTVQNVGG